MRPKGPNRPKPSPSSRHPTAIGDAIRQFFRETGLRRPAGDERVFQAWTSALAPEWRRCAVPVSFRAGQLVVEVTSSVELAELKNYHAEGYRKKANASLGEPLIQKVAVKLKS